MPTPEPLQGFLLPDYEDGAAIPDDLRRLTADLIGISAPRFSTAAQRDAAYPAPSDGQMCSVAANSAFYVGRGGQWQVLWAAGRDGTWQDYTPTFTNVTFQALTVARWCRIGNTVHVRFRATLAAAPTGYFAVGLPVPMTTPLAPNDHPSGAAVARIGAGRTVGVVSPLDVNSIRFASTGTTDALTIWNASYPSGWASGSSLGFEMTYEVAG